MKKLAIIQTGRLGDTIYALPIAKYYYDNGFQIDWIIHDNYKDILENIHYLNDVIIVPKNIDIMYSIKYVYDNFNLIKYDKVIDLSIWFPYSKATVFKNINFIHDKYMIAGVPISYVNKLSYDRNIEKENLLYDEVIKNKKDYVLTNLIGSSGKILDLPFLDNQIEITPIAGYNLFDWRKIIENAKEVHCIESSLQAFLEVLEDFKHIKKYIYFNRTDSSESYFKTAANIKNNWIVK